MLDSLRRESLVTALAVHYSRFRVADRLLLTGHSHQAWPDVAFEAQQQAWLDAAELVDGKWDKAAEMAQRVREGYARLLGDRAENIALGQNTHELVTRWLSALPLRPRDRLVTTDGEFHTIRRQLDRLAEEGLEVLRIPAHPVATLADRLSAALNHRSVAVLVSSVLFETAEIVPDLDTLAAVCDRRGTPLLIDAYHHLNVVPFDPGASVRRTAFVTGGGYKYCQLGEGNCFLRVPDGCTMRPVLTGWFAEFDTLQESHTGRVQYRSGAAAFAGATYDPTSHYRAAAVFDFHQRMGLTPGALRDISRRQVGILQRAFEALDVPERIARIDNVPPEGRGGFLAIRSSRAQQLATALRSRGVFVDARAGVLRFGPAPYLRDDQLTAAIAAFGELLR